ENEDPERNAVLRSPDKGAQTSKECRGFGQTWRPKEDPGEADEVEDDGACEPRAQRPERVAGVLFQRERPPNETLEAQRCAVNAAPYDEGPVGTVPQSSKQHRQ